MSTYRRPLGAVLAVAVLAFALAFGAVSGAGAAGLTSKTVKKIATKVVKKQSRSLSVAHADTADSATTAASAASAATATVAGKVQARSYTVSDVGSAMTHNITFPGLPAGTYLATYSLAVNLASGNTIYCGFDPGSVAPSQAAAPANNFATVSGAGVVTVGAGFKLGCTATGTFEVNPYYGETVSFVPVTTIAAAANQS